MTMTETRQAVVVGLSGCSSSGKTTLARLLRDIFPSTFVLHEDDFYKAETELPMKDGLLDWDCAESISIPDVVKSLEYIHQHGTFPPDLDSKEDQNTVGECPVPNEAIEDLKARVKTWTAEGNPGFGILTASQNPIRLCIFDGFLLYSHSMISVQPQMDIKIFLRVSYAKAKARREARSGYVTMEGFWQDPPGYVDKIVWPNYVEDHKFMFDNGDVEGRLKKEVVERWDLNVPEHGLDVDMTTTLNWAVDLLMRKLPDLANKS